MGKSKLDDGIDTATDFAMDAAGCRQVTRRSTQPAQLLHSQTRTRSRYTDGAWSWKRRLRLTIAGTASRAIGEKLFLGLCSWRDLLPEESVVLFPIQV